MSPDTLAFLVSRIEALDLRMTSLEDRVGVLETVTGDIQSEVDEIQEGAFEDNYVKGKPDGKADKDI